MEERVMRVSKIAQNQWKQLVGKPCRSQEELIYKVRRAFDLGKVSYRFIKSANTHSYIKRYYDLNLIVTNNVIQVIQRHKGSPMVMIPLQRKLKYDKIHGYVPPTKEEIEILKKQKVGEQECSSQSLDS